MGNACSGSTQQTKTRPKPAATVGGHFVSSEVQLLVQHLAQADQLDEDLCKEVNSSLEPRLQSARTACRPLPPADRQRTYGRVFEAWRQDVVEAADLKVRHVVLIAALEEGARSRDIFMAAEGLPPPEQQRQPQDKPAPVTAAAAKAVSPLPPVVVGHPAAMVHSSAPPAKPPAQAVQAPLAAPVPAPAPQQQEPASYAVPPPPVPASAPQPQPQPQPVQYAQQPPPVYVAAQPQPQVVYVQQQPQPVMMGPSPGSAFLKGAIVGSVLRGSRMQRRRRC